MVDPPPVERCAECGFDGARWTDQDVTTGARAFADLVDGYLGGASEAVAQTRPSRDQWSVGEYVGHLADTLELGHRLIGSAFDHPGVDAGDLPRPSMAAEVERVDLDATRIRLAVVSDRLHEVLASRPTQDWPRSTVVVRGRLVDVGWIGRHLAHEVMHHVHDIGRIRVALGDGVAPRRGAVVQLNVSDGGVPKRPVPELDVTWSGPVGDRQNDRRHHGRPFQALCLWSAEAIAELAGLGHPIGPGLAGENLTVSGLDWPALRPGVVFSVGTVRAELSCYAVPCAKNAGWFADRDFNRIHHQRNPQWSRLYATVLEPGHLSVGDAVEIEPDVRS